MCHLCTTPSSLRAPSPVQGCDCPCPGASIVQGDGASPRKCRRCNHGLPAP